MTTYPKFPLKLTAAAAMVVVSLALGGLAGCGGGTNTDAVAVAVAPPPLIGAESTGSKVMSWFAQIADSCYEIALGVASIADGNVKAGVSEFAAAGFGLIGKGLDSGESGDDQAKQLNAINGKLDALTGAVQSIANQETNTNLAVLDLTSLVLMQPMQTAVNEAQPWLDNYYTGLQPEQSRAWVNWKMAGCDLLASACTSTYPAVTADSLAAFRNGFVNHANNPMVYNTDNFPLWWAYGVVADLTTAGPKYSTKGGTASQLENGIYHSIVDANGIDPNGLVSYMNYFMNQKGNKCATDITDPACDLYANVYLPLESYFALAIGRQSQLVMAQAEAWNVLEQQYPTYKGSANMVMDGYKQKLNEEVEVFLQVAEQLALYRAADGRTDWSNFAATDAGKLLARADFIVAQLAGKNYPTTSTIPALTVGYVNPPWPSSGIVGRVFYANGEQMPTGTRMLAMDSTVGAQYQPNQSLSEDDTSKRAVTGVLQPYLLWTRSVDAKGAVTMIGTANTQWSVRRLVAQPITLPIGLDFQVTSSQPTRLGAKLGLYNYDENFVTPPAPGTSSVIPFGSFSSVEGNIGGAGLALDPGSIKADMNSTLYDASYNASTINAGAVSLSVTYVPNKDYKPGNSDLWGGKGMTAGTWSVASTAVKLVIPPKGATAVKISWPSVVNVSLDSDRQILGGLGGNGVGREEYYSYVKFQQHILDSKGKALTGGSVVNDRCTSSPFFKCQIDNSQIDSSQSVDLTMLTAAATAANLSFAANFSTEVEQYNERMVWFSKYATVRTSIAPSVASWQIQAPMLTLIR